MATFDDLEVAGDEAAEPRCVLLDTNVLLDYVDRNRPEHATARGLIHLLLGGNFLIFACAHSFKDMYYILQRAHHSEEIARRLVRGLLECVPMTPLDLTNDILVRSVASDEPDFEDGLVRSTAETVHIGCIVTRDAKAFTGSSVPVLSPQELLASLQ